VIGTPGDCLRQLLGWRDGFGVDHFALRTRRTSTRGSSMVTGERRRLPTLSKARSTVSSFVQAR
jgi:hypothetical protein